MTTFAKPKLNDMSSFERDIFYETDHLSLQEKREILVLAHELCYQWKWDQLVGFHRETVEGKMFKDCLEGFREQDHFVFIHRKGGVSLHSHPTEWCIETGYTHHNRNGYLFIFVEDTALKLFEDTFNLTPSQL